MKKNLFEFWKIKGIVLLNLFLIAFSSCQKEENNPTTELPIVKSEGITFKDGRLIFKDEATFINHQQWLLKNQGNRQLIADKNKSLGLTSMTEIYFDGLKLEETDPLFLAYLDKYPNIFIKQEYDNSTLYLLPHSTILCYVANKDGIYQVGEVIYRVAGDYIYELRNADESKIKMLMLSRDQISDGDIKIFPSVSNRKGEWAQRTRYFTSNWRIVSSLNVHFSSVYDYYEILTNPQHRVFGIWGRAQLATRSANGDGYYEFNNIPITGSIYSNAAEETGLSTLTMVTKFTDDGNIVDFTKSFAPAYSRGRLDLTYIYVYWPDALENNPPFEEPNWTPGVDEPF